MGIKNSCFVCKAKFSDAEKEMNLVVNMPVCKKCKGTEQEKQAEKELLKSLADGFVCGCI